VKKYYLIPIIVLFAFLTKAQPPQNMPGPDLKIGETVPDFKFQVLNNAVSKPARISDFRGKWLLLDFWATWCSPCVQMIPRLDSLQRRFHGQIQIISVSGQAAGLVRPFLDRLKTEHHFELAEVMGDTALSACFKPASLPYFAWIDPAGKFMAFTDAALVNSTSIQNALAGKDPGWKIKPEVIIGYDSSKSLFQETNPGANNTIVYHAVLTGYKEGLGSGFYSDVTNTKDTSRFRRITARNLTVAQLYQIAMSDGYRTFNWDRTVLAVKDTTALNSRLSGQDFDEWLKADRGFCYELIVPLSMASSATAIMRRDLAAFFPKYQASVETKIVPCMALETLGGAVDAPTEGDDPEVNFDFTGAYLHNCGLNVLAKRMALYFQKYKLPVVNDTGYKGRVDLEIHADLTDLAAVNKELAQYHLQFVRKDLPREILVIRDN